MTVLFKKHKEYKEEAKIIDYGYPQSKEEPFDTYATALRDFNNITDEVVHISSKNCSLIMRITEKVILEDRNIDRTLKKSETYFTYKNIYKTSNGNYIYQCLTPETYAKSHQINNSNEVYPISKADAVRMYTKAIKNESLIDSFIGFSSRTQYVNCELFDENALKIREW